MSRIGKAPITVPTGVEIKINGLNLEVKGSKGTLNTEIHPLAKVNFKDGMITVERVNEEKFSKSVHGLTRSLVNNMVIGVTEGYKKELEINGVGYRAAKQGKDLVLNIGYSHQVTFSDTADILLEVPAPNRIIVSGIDKQKVGQTAAEIRASRPPEPYLGKGIKYAGEHIIRKEGKAGKGAKK